MVERAVRLWLRLRGGSGRAACLDVVSRALPYAVLDCSRSDGLDAGMVAAGARLRHLCGVTPARARGTSGAGGTLLPSRTFAGYADWLAARRRNAVGADYQPGTGTVRG